LNPNDLAALYALGWGDDFAADFAALANPTLMPARVAIDRGSQFLVEFATGAGDALLASGALRQAGRNVAVGDWVAVKPRADRLFIEHVLPRRSAIARKVADSESVEQILAANVDLVLIATALGPDFNIRRVERFLTLAYQSGASPVVLLTKSDLDDPADYEGRIASVAAGVPTLAVSALHGDGIDAVRTHLPPGKTGVLVGSSGVGKSTLINRLLGSQVLRTAAVHQSGQGRHTTSHRQLLKLPGAGLIIDTPGLREIQLWAGEDALQQVFSEIEALALECRFSDCRHQQEPGCAVRSALDDGRLDQRRFASYRKLRRELRSIEVRADVRLQIEARRKWKQINRAATERMKTKQRLG
jgi:ribosome biogenesis GTPase / thiamine phosphate phosphatase